MQAAKKHTYILTYTHAYTQALDGIIAECEVQKVRLQQQQASGNAALASPEALKDWALTTPHNPSGYVCVSFTCVCVCVYVCVCVRVYDALRL
jgi:hypothetical protein